MGKLDNIRQIVDEVIKDCKKLKKENQLSSEGKSQLDLANRIKHELNK